MIEAYSRIEDTATLEKTAGCEFLVLVDYSLHESQFVFSEEGEPVCIESYHYRELMSPYRLLEVFSFSHRLRLRYMTQVDVAVLNKGVTYEDICRCIGICRETLESIVLDIVIRIEMLIPIHFISNRCLAHSSHSTHLQFELTCP